MILLRPKVPTTFEEASRIREEMCDLFTRCLTESYPEQLDLLVKCLKNRLDMLQLIRAHFDAEVRRMEKESHPIALDRVTAGMNRVEIENLIERLKKNDT